MADDGDVDGDDKEKSVHEDIVSLLLDYFIKDKQQILIFQTVKESTTRTHFIAIIHGILKRLWEKSVPRRTKELNCSSSP